MKKLFLIFTGIFLLIISAYPQSVGAEKGVLTYQGEKSLALSGEWKFFWKQLYSDDSTLLHSDNFQFVSIPDIWKNIQVDDSKQLASQGYASYSLQILCDDDFKDAAIEIPVFYSAYVLYLNGEPISKNGRVSKSKENSLPQWKPITKLIELHKGTNQLVLEVSNFDHSKAGFFADINIGSADYLVHKREMNLIVVMFIIGSLFVVGIFNLAMFGFWRKDKVIFYYALFAISFAVRLSATGLIVLTQVFESIPGLVAIKIEYISFYLTWLFLALFAGSNYEEDMGKWFKKLIVGISLAVAIATLVLPLKIYSQLMMPYVYFGFIMLSYGIFVAFKVLVNKRNGSLLFGIGTLLVFIGALWSASMYLIGTPVIAYTHNLVLLLAFLFMSFVLAKRFGTAYRTIEKLHKESLEQRTIIENLNASQSRWFNNIAHELRTPLTLILGPIRQFLKKHSDSTDLSLASIQMAEKNSERLLNLVNEILDVSKIESNHLKLKKASTNLTQMINESMAYFKESAEGKGVSFSSDIGQKAFIDVDKLRIQNVLNNLIANALKFTHRGGSIEINTTVKWKKGIFIAVTDTGDGIPEKDIELIFERYYQASDTESLNQGGVGIGLSLSSEIVELHGGKLRVCSKVNEGSTFLLQLPVNLIVSIEEANAEESLNHQSFNEFIEMEASSLHNQSIDSPKPLILLVEDNPDMRKYVSGLLQEDYAVFEAVDGYEAMEFVKDNIPDLIISDIMMPRINGFQLLKSLRSQASTENISVIMLTAHGAREDRLKALIIGVDDYITKPFDEEELQARIRYMINNKKAKNQWIETNPDGDKESVSTDKEFLLKAEELIISALSNYNYSVLDLAEEMGISERQLFRKLKSATGMSPLHYIREIRLQKARKLLELNKTETISEVMHAVGFRKSDYFAKLYRERFGKLPSHYNSVA